MELLLEVKNEKVNFFLELVQNLPFVKIKNSQNIVHEEQRESIKQAIKEIKQVKSGELQPKSLKEVLDEL